MKAATKQRRVGIYVRVSQDRDGDEATTKRQEEDCRVEVATRGWTVIEPVYRDTDVSAYDRRVVRPEFERLKADLKAGHINAIVFWKLDRLARRPKDVSEICDLLEDARGVMVAAKENIDSTDSRQRGLIELMGAIAQISSADTGERVRRAKLEEARKGRASGGGNHPFGWKVATERRDLGNGKVATITKPSDELDLRQAAALRIVVRWFLNGDGKTFDAEGKPTTVGLFRLSKWLNTKGFTTNGSKEYPDGKLFETINLRNVLQNPRLAGFRQHRTGDAVGRDRGEPRIVYLYQGTWQPIIKDFDTFRRLQERFGRTVFMDDGQLKVSLPLVKREPGADREPIAKERHLLTGMLWCGKCRDGRMRVMRNKKNGTRYVCRICATVTIGKELAEDHIVKLVLDTLMGRIALGDDKRQGDAEDLAKLESTITKYREQLRKLSVRYFVEEDIDEDEYEASRRPLHDRITALQGRVEHGGMQPQPIPGGGTREGFDVWWANADLNERRRAIDGAIKRVVIAPLSHDITQFYRRPGTELPADRTVLPTFGVPKDMWEHVARARINIEWRPEVQRAAPAPTRAEWDAFRERLPYGSTDEEKERFNTLEKAEADAENDKEWDAAKKAGKPVLGMSPGEAREAGEEQRRHESEMVGMLGPPLPMLGPDGYVPIPTVDEVQARQPPKRPRRKGSSTKR